ncbi:uncharacterized protein ACA1_307000 [Acanthamoeba castellanii str. Neff]|uniref:Uncharacterized protein n=1 Tax=Acanthamoeba castellanii (strain ATCC 30010 / Neff) TaxID=1257118 RepID=L8GTH3_ACACF|nr:uncharacterized protein ACA1_307000 [Acanthamoeba castellanii str. Neff]ELR16484.1 hypothetical protein ACA1_307000 [Acanthamoeba castellanii str. Neff]
MNCSMFLAINKKWGPHTINQMATSHNTQLPHYHSHFFKPGSTTTNCLVQDWFKHRAPLPPSSPQCGAGATGARTSTTSQSTCQSHCTHQRRHSSVSMGHQSHYTTVDGAGRPIGCVGSVA